MKQLVSVYLNSVTKLTRWCVFSILYRCNSCLFMCTRIFHCISISKLQIHQLMRRGLFHEWVPLLCKVGVIWVFSYRQMKELDKRRKREFYDTLQHRRYYYQVLLKKETLFVRSFVRYSSFLNLFLPPRIKRAVGSVFAIWFWQLSLSLSSFISQMKKIIPNTKSPFALNYFFITLWNIKHRSSKLFSIITRDKNVSAVLKISE